MSGLGQPRQIGPLPTLAACPLRSDCDRAVLLCSEWRDVPKNGLMHCSKQHRYSISSSGVALLGRLALTVAQNLGIAAERIHDYSRDEFDTR